MDKVLMILLIIVAIVIIKNILALETITLPLWGGGSIIYFGSLAERIKNFFVFLIVIALFCCILYVRYVFRGVKKRKLKNDHVEKRTNLKKVKVNDLDTSYDIDDEIIEEETFLLKHSEIKEYVLPENDLNIVNEIKKIDSQFNEKIFLAKAHDFSKELIKTELIKSTSAKYVYEAFNTGKIVVGVPVFHSVKKIDDHYAIKLRTNKYKHNKLKSSYEMIFLKIIKKDVVALKCPRCGAPLQKRLGGICRYCFKYNDKESKTKIKSNVSKFSYDIPIVKFASTKFIPKVCINCGAPLKKENKGICEYCKSDNRTLDSEWVMMEFYEIYNEETKKWKKY